MASSPDRDGGAGEADLVGTLAARVAAMDDRIRATEVVDEKTLKELRRTIEALSKRDPKFEERVTNRVDVVADRIETVARTISTASAALAAKDGEIAQLRRDLEAGLSRANSTFADRGRGADAAEVAELKRALADLTKLTNQKLPRGLESRVDELGAKLEWLAQRIDSVSTTVSTAAAGLAGREGDVNALRRAFETSIERVGSELAELRRQVDPTPVLELQQGLKELADETSRQLHRNQQLHGQTGAKVDALADGLSSLATSLTATTSRIAGAEQELSAFRIYFEDAGGRLSALLGEQQQALAALSARAVALEQADADTARAVDQHAADTSDKVDDLAGQLRSLATSTTSTASKIAATEDELASLRTLIDEADQRMSSLVEERAASTSDKVDDLAGRLRSLATSTTSTASRIAGTEDELSSLRAYVEDAGGRLSSLVAEQQQALAALSVRAGALEQADDQVARALDERVSSASTRIDDLAGRVDPLGATVASMSERIDARDAALQSLERRFHDASSRVDSLVADLSRALAELPDPNTVARTLTPRIDDVAERTATLTEDVMRVESKVIEQLRASTDVSARLEHHLNEELGAIGDLSGRLDSLATSTTSTASRIAGTEDELSSLRAYVEDAGGRLSSLVAEQQQALAALSVRAAALEQADDGELAVRIAELTGKLGAAEDEGAETAGEVARVAAILEVERASVRARLDTLEAALSKASAASSSGEIERRLAELKDALDTERVSSQAQFEAIANALASSPYHTALEQRLEELGRRLDEVEQRGAAVATKVSHASTLLPTALRSLEARLDEVAPGSRRPPSDPEGRSLHDAHELAPSDTEEALDAAAIVPVPSAEA